MTDLFEEHDDKVQDVAVDYTEDEIEAALKSADASRDGLDARRRLEHLMDEKRLRDELEDDFI